MKQSHPKSWLPHLSGDAAAPTVGCQHQPEEGLAGVLSQLPGKQPSVCKIGHHLEKKKNSIFLFLFILIEREWSRAYSIIIIIIQDLTLICYDFIIYIYHLSDWLPLAKQKSTLNFELEMLVNILLKFENSNTIIEKRKIL